MAAMEKKEGAPGSEELLPTKVKCPHCATELELDGNERRTGTFTCPKCGRSTTPEGEETSPIIGGIKNFLKLKTTLSTKTILLFYPIGVLFIFLATVVVIWITPERQFGILLGVIIFFVGNLIWRFVCEGWIALFSIYEALGTLEKKTTDKSKDMMSELR
jgi:uncharacterized protein YbaR (Trm112 family)